ncbi:hypothetical protein COT99_00910 [Candidatus Falkowbacteria bacterium CG10_big_fil_rev_8_21_14_0_10_43_10]|uniref:Uncharacterized protein n=1 Tax=Candidatus Falkowbacteria bacterium CG10_big_fil_rev_8_21_14_0_10_43_10 TaxID=1974567 RepID=A0A2H0V2P9_9BACT|nr:MAG: hypothetical protein COT99_00910 [Candidatus Falkowbacteria bacterium CG10_big_fil_rev_8_21_14_0_10_43_10]
MLHIILGLIGMVIGALITIYSEKMLNAFGRIPFFEKYLGFEGGSRLGYKIIGLLIFFISLLIMTNLIQEFLMWVLLPILAPMKRTF